MNFKKFLKSISDLFNSFFKLNIYIKIFVYIFLIFFGFFSTFTIWYKSSIGKKSNDVTSIIVNIATGSTNSEIADTLKRSNVINSALSFKLFIKLNHVSILKAGNYLLNQSMSVNEIIEKLQNGSHYDENSFNITFIEGKTMSWIADKIASSTNNTKQDVFNTLKDSNYINSLIEKYWFLSEAIKKEDLYYPLEGYLFPDTYNLPNKDVSVKEIFNLMLDKMLIVLSTYKDAIENNTYSIHQLLTLASVIESEAISSVDRKTIASVLYNRLKAGMSLGSDVTTYYAFKIELGKRDLTQKELNTYNAYNTRGPKMNGKFPIGPICSSGQSSIEAAIFPASTSYLYFVADKNGVVYFSKSLSEHSKIIEKIKASGNWINF